MQMRYLTVHRTGFNMAPSTSYTCLKILRCKDASWFGSCLSALNSILYLLGWASTHFDTCNLNLPFRSLSAQSSWSKMMLKALWVWSVLTLLLVLHKSIHHTTTASDLDEVTQIPTAALSANCSHAYIRGDGLVVATEPHLQKSGMIQRYSDIDRNAHASVFLSTAMRLTQQVILQRHKSSTFISTFCTLNVHINKIKTDHINTVTINMALQILD